MPYRLAETETRFGLTPQKTEFDDDPNLLAHKLNAVGPTACLAHMDYHSIAWSQSVARYSIHDNPMV